jgi:hypothetical protein
MTTPDLARIAGDGIDDTLRLIVSLATAGGEVGQAERTLLGRCAIIALMEAGYQLAPISPDLAMRKAGQEAMRFGNPEAVYLAMLKESFLSIATAEMALS